MGAENDEREWIRQSQEGRVEAFHALVAGKDWGVSLRNTGYTEVYNAAITRLDKLRASSVK